MQLVYFSGTGVTKRIAWRFDGRSLKEYDGGEYVLLFPSYGAPGQGLIPQPVQRFLEKHSGNLRAVAGVGNVTFGPDFCRGAEQVARHYNVPLLAAIDVHAQRHELDKIKRFLEGEKVESILPGA
uniref:Ribonucleotide reductase stimulatory protein n=1 Tax=Siphoviridae sp. ctGkF2 TaxID=2827823 RepID=A0A8S5TKX7_9CAUD|nr:MAG TPA: ribonucleotide reductase stimulatory protein [Siphoviridae sp. ctGkF2]